MSYIMLGYNIHQFMATRDNDKLRDENTELKKQNEELQKQTVDLQKELDFMKSISEHYNSLVSNMYVKTKNGEKVWVDRLTITKKELLELDKDDDVVVWLQSINVKFKDNDW